MSLAWCLQFKFWYLQHINWVFEEYENLPLLYFHAIYRIFSCYLHGFYSLFAIKSMFTGFVCVKNHYLLYFHIFSMSLMDIRLIFRLIYKLFRCYSQNRFFRQLA